MKQVSQERTATLFVLFRSPLFISVLLFLAAFVLRLHFALAHPHFDNLFAVRGVPFSDAQQWVSAGIQLAAGQGLGTVYRPGLSVALALIYTWSGRSFELITGFNIIVGAVTASLVFLVGRRAFAQTIGIAAALFFVLDPSQLVQVPQASTEPLGLLFFVSSVYCLMRVQGPRANRWAFSAGVFLALSNLTRPLTLFCVPFYALHLYLAEGRGPRRGKMLLPMLAFCAGTVLMLSPWLVRQRLVHGVWTISANLGEALYGATSPKYKTWTRLVRADADRDHVERTVAARYRYFMARSLDNIRRYPSFYLHQVTHSFWIFLHSFNAKMRARVELFKYPYWTRLLEAQIQFFWLLAALLIFSGFQIWKSSGGVAGAIFLAVSALLLILGRYAPPESGIATVLLGLIASVWLAGWRPAALLTWSVFGTGAGDALFNDPILYRAVLMTDWIYSLLYLAAFYVVAFMITDWLLHISTRERMRFQGKVPPISVDPAVVRFEDWVRAGLKGLALSLSILIAAGTVRLVAANFGKQAHEPHFVARLSELQKREVIARLRSLSPPLRTALPDPSVARLVSDEPDAPETLAVEPTTRQKGDLLVSRQRLSDYVFYFPPGTGFAERDPRFARREYPRSIFLKPSLMVVFPGTIPASLQGREVILVGRSEGAPFPKARPAQVIRGLAILPTLDENAEIDYAHTVEAAQIANIF